MEPNETNQKDGQATAGEGSLLFKAAESLNDQYGTTAELIQAIRTFIIDHALTLPEEYEAKSLIESRFTPAEEAFEKGMLSCGAMVNICEAMLKHVGFKVRLIHGESEDSVDHAWISVQDDATEEWNEYDLTVEGVKVPATNVKKSEVNSWEEIREQLESDHYTYHERKAAREGNQA